MTDETNADNQQRSVLDDATELTEATARRLIDSLHRAQHLAPVRHIRRYQVATAVLGAVGAALFLVGIERAAEDIPLLSNPYGSIVAGVMLLALTGTLFARLGGGH